VKASAGIETCVMEPDRRLTSASLGAVHGPIAVTTHHAIVNADSRDLPADSAQGSSSTDMNVMVS